MVERKSLWDRLKGFFSMETDDGTGASYKKIGYYSGICRKCMRNIGTYIFEHALTGIPYIPCGYCGADNWIRLSVSKYEVNRIDLSIQAFKIAKGHHDIEDAEEYEAIKEVLR